MSLHIELSEEARQQLAIQQRNSTIASILIAVLGLTLLGLLLTLFMIKFPKKKIDTLQAVVIPNTTEAAPTPPKTPTRVKSTPSSPSASSSPVLTADTLSPVSVPTPEVPTLEFSETLGDDSAFGDGWGDGNGTGTGGNSFNGIPSTMSKRCSPSEREERLLSSGGTKECELAVQKGLLHLKNTQKKDGSWAMGRDSYKAGMTGLALLAYLGHCETPISEKFGTSCTNAITYLIKVAQAGNGAMATNTADNHWIYEHAIATYALAEAYTFCKELGVDIPELKETVLKAGQLIIDKQDPATGGWSYDYLKNDERSKHVDLSITGWHIQALKACRHTQLEFKGLEKAWKKSEDYVEYCKVPDKGFGYTGPRSHTTFGYDSLTGVGVLSLQLLGKENSKATREGLRYIEDNSKFDYALWGDLYAHYYEGQACINKGGKTWEKYNTLFRDTLLKNQNEDGSWKAPGQGGQVNAVVGNTLTGPAHYRTCLSILMLEVYYRFLPGTADKK